MPSPQPRALIFLLTLLTPALACAQPTATLSRVTLRQPRATAFDGHYRLAGGQASVRRAVDGVCDRLDFITRAIARPILEDRNQPYQRVELSVDGSVARFTLGDWGPVGTRLGAVRTLPNERGESTRVAQRLVGGQLVQTFTTDQGTRRNVFTVSEDGRRLTLDVLISSPRLPGPMRYRLIYERTPDATPRAFRT